MDASTLFADLTYATPTSTTTGGHSPMLFIIAGILGLLSIIAMWRTFQKAKQPGWAAIIPFYNLYILLKIVGRPGWWLILFLIPLVSLIISIVVAIDLAKAFGKSTAYGVIGLWLFSIIGYFMLGFGKATYKGAPQH